jgi:hypothetical protein
MYFRNLFSTNNLKKTFFGLLVNLIFLIMSLKTHLLILLNVSFVSCTSGQLVVSDTSAGLIELNIQLYDTVGNQFSKPVLSIKDKVWYKDSIVIEEVHSIKIVSSSSQPATQEIILENYRFNDLRTRMVYEYKHFADSAKITRIYSLDDTTKIYGGWDFKFKRKLEYQGSPEGLSDTIIDQIGYKRVKLKSAIKYNPFFMICYFRCDRKGTMFDIDPPLSKMIGCPLVKIITFSPIKQETPSSSEINFLSETLTKEELKIFDAWERNAKNNPVNK